MLSGYDRAITVFSPDGRLLQVEYALAATKRTPLAVGMKCSDGVILAAIKRHISPLARPPKKIYEIDEHIGAVAAGLVGDGLILVDRSRIEAQYHRLVFGEPISVETLAKRVALFKQQYTQYAGLRPFGVIMIYGGVDDSPKLFVTHPGGAYYAYSAFAVGRNSDRMNETLKKLYRPDVTVSEGIKAVVNSMIESVKEGGEEIGVRDIEAAVIMVSDRRFKILSEEELAGMVEGG
ncbi:MAG: proteasome subunit alpha [Thermoproteota archaeon]|nr:MAG: proteasome subunit alpha [Candidatus Korarchaeota archaeon]